MAGKRLTAGFIFCGSLIGTGLVLGLSPGPEQNSSLSATPVGNSETVGSFVSAANAKLESTPVVNADDWKSWRGAGNRAVTSESEVATGKPIVRFGPNNSQWKISLPGKGCSTPIVVGGQIYLTAPVEGVDALLCYDENGEQQFQTIFGAEVAGKHLRGSGSNASPISDGSAVYVYFKSGNLAAVELSGETRWQVDLVEKYGRESLYWDHGTSPVLTEKCVVMARMDERDSWLAAFDKQTGELQWKVDRNYKTPQECDHGYSTPVVMQFAGQEAILTWGAEHITIHSASNGRLLWSCGNFNPTQERLWPTIASPVVIDEMAIVAFGRADRGTPRLHGVRLTGEGNVTATNHAWKRDDIGTFVPTPVAFGKNVLVLGDKGEIECLDPQTGDSVWRDRFPQSRWNFYASPLLIGDHLYTVRENGSAYVAKVSSRGFELVDEDEFKQPIIGSPIPFNGGILVRGESNLFFVSAQ